MKKLQNAIHWTAGALLLAGSFAVLCAPAFSQTQTPPKPPASGASSTTTKPAAPPRTKSTAKPSGTTKTTGSGAPRTSTTGRGTTASAKKKSTASKSARVKMQTAPTSERITEIQSALAKAGAYDGDPTGNWDARTIAAMTKFQQANGLTPSGKLDALSLQKLGLGSETSGKGAPRPTTHSTTAASSSTGIRR